MFKKKKGVIAVDISNSKICALIAREGASGKVDVLAASMKETSGLKEGVVIDIGKTSEDLKSVLNELKRNYRGLSNSLYLNISGSHLDTNYCHGALLVANAKGIISKKEIKDVINSAYAHGVSLDRLSIHNLPGSYTVDEHEGVIDPLGMYAKKLEVDLFVVTAVSNYINNLKKSVNQAGYRVKELVASGFAASYALLTQEEKESGIILIDIGAGLSDVAVFSKGRLKALKVIPKGGNEITKNLSKSLKISLAYAEEIKKRYGCALKDEEEREEVIVLRNSNEDFKGINRDKINSIVKSNLKDIFLEIEKRLKDSNSLEDASCGIVITGGVALLDGMIEMAQAAFDMPVCLGLAHNFNSSLKLDPCLWSNCLGLARYALIKKEEDCRASLSSNPLTFIKKKIQDFLIDYF